MGTSLRREGSEAIAFIGVARNMNGRVFFRFVGLASKTAGAKRWRSLEFGAQLVERTGNASLQRA